MRWQIAFSGGASDACLVDIALWLRSQAGDEIAAVCVEPSRSEPNRHAASSEHRATLSARLEIPIAVVRGDAVSSKLVAHTAEHADGLVLGQRSGLTQTLARVGQATRRVLRHATFPCLVVPARPVGDPDRGGPILVAVRDTPDGAAAAELARSLAQRAQRSLAACHVADSQERATTEFKGIYAAAHLADAQRYPVCGHVPEGLLQLARQIKPSMIVCGNRRLSDGPRHYSASVGSLLASAAEVPVLVVPQ